MCVGAGDPSNPESPEPGLKNTMHFGEGEAPMVERVRLKRKTRSESKVVSSAPPPWRRLFGHSNVPHSAGTMNPVIFGQSQAIYNLPIELSALTPTSHSTGDDRQSGPTGGGYYQLA
jgi:hypothetical protein